MIDWSDGIRRDTPAFFCQAAYERTTKPVVIVSDIRRRTDIEFFRSLQQSAAATDEIVVKTVRISVDDSVRRERGWTFQEGVDDVASECDLDAFDEWDFEITNDAGRCPDELLKGLMQSIIPVLEQETQF